MRNVKENFLMEDILPQRVAVPATELEPER
jgi:hypothetical protein